MLDGGEEELRRAGDVAAADAERESRQSGAAADAGLPHRGGGGAHSVARMRSSIRWRAPSTPGSPSNARSRAPSSRRTDSRSISPGGGAWEPDIPPGPTRGLPA